METSILYSKSTIEFLTVATEFCSFIERPSNDRKEFVLKCTKILPLLYLKGLLLPEINDDSEIEEEPENFVTEEIYQYVRLSLEKIMGEKDDYLEVFNDDIQYSDQPITEFVSENLADIYQDIKNFVSIFSLQYEPTMLQALSNVVSDFKSFWAQKLVNVLRPLNHILLTIDEDDFYDESEQKENGKNSDWLFSNLQDKSDLDMEIL